MELMVKIGFIIFLSLVVFFITIYLPRMKAWFYGFKKQKKLVNDKKNKIALIVPARRESEVIGTLFDSIKRQTYKNFVTYVIVKDYDDPTIEMAKEIDARVLVLPSQKKKADCLDYALKEALKDKEIDAAFIIDADCYLEDNAIEELNNAMASNRQIIQVKKRVKNFYMNKKANSLWSSCNGLIWTIIDDLGNKYKSSKNITGMLIGTGIMIRRDVLIEMNGWPYDKTLTEDIEFMNDAAIKGYSTFYYEHAIIYLEESTSLKVTNKRRDRWMNGVINSKRIYNKELHDKATSKNAYYCTALSPVFHLITTCMVYAFLNLVFTVIFALLHNELYLTTLLLGLLSIGIIYASFFILTLFILLTGHINRPWYVKLLLLFIHPIFYMGYITICAKIYLGLSSNKWEVIDRVKFEA